MHNSCCSTLRWLWSLNQLATHGAAYSCMLCPVGSDVLDCVQIRTTPVANNLQAGMAQLRADFFVGSCWVLREQCGSYIDGDSAVFVPTRPCLYIVAVLSLHSTNFGSRDTAIDVASRQDKKITFF